jgi:hypothetical protein
MLDYNELYSSFRSNADEFILIPGEICVWCSLESEGTEWFTILLRKGRKPQGAYRSSNTVQYTPFIYQLSAQS